MTPLKRAMLLRQHKRIMDERAILKELIEFRGGPFSANHLADLTGLPEPLVLRHLGRPGQRGLEINVADLDKVAAIVENGLTDEAVWHLVDRGTSTTAIAALTGYRLHRVRRANRRYGKCSQCGWGKMKTATLCESCYQRMRRNNG